MKPQCHVRGCKRVNYKHGLCRKHWNEVPLIQRLRVMTDAIDAAQKASRKHDGTLKKCADNYAAGVTAGQGKRSRAL